ncbi:hypothetical protein SDC9_118441 [bioreactor metagenome]|uniref:Uncharacterized protein n=1 Tax=bioreactor metagenome TaxID=1076179 RepID=A0A645C0Y7_9ZZZZ
MTEYVVHFLKTVYVQKTQAGHTVVFRKVLVKHVQPLDARVAVIAVCHHVIFGVILHLLFLHPVAREKHGQNCGDAKEHKVEYIVFLDNIEQQVADLIFKEMRIRRIGWNHGNEIPGSGLAENGAPVYFVGEYLSGKKLGILEVSILGQYRSSWILPYGIPFFRILRRKGYTGCRIIHECPFFCGFILIIKPISLLVNEKYTSCVGSRDGLNLLENIVGRII